MKKIALIVLAILLAACTATPTARPTPSAVDIDAEEQAVYAALIQAMYPAELYVIMEYTATDVIGLSEDIDSTLAQVSENMNGLSQEVIKNFKTRNDRSYPLRDDMLLGFEYVLLSQEERNELFAINQNGWEMFYNRYPDSPGIITLSRVGFNARLDEALVYIGNQSHWMAGAGYYVLLKKENGLWVIKQQVLVWIS